MKIQLLPQIFTIRHSTAADPIFRVTAIFAVLTSLIFGTADASIIFSSVSQQRLSVGDRVLFSVTTVVPKGATVQPPDPASSFGSVTVKEWNNKKVPLTKADSVVFDYVITTYKAENCTIPALPYYIENGSSKDTLKTEPLVLTVIPLCTSDTLDIMDLKPQQVTGNRPLLWLWLLLGAIGIIAAVLLARYYIKKLRKPPPPPPPKPPYEEAIEALAALDAKLYPTKGMVREYVFELSDIIKRYIERRFEINAAEFTTEEMLAWLGISPLDKSERAAMEWFFRTTDPVKFAKFLPDQKTMDRFGVEVRAVLEATRPREQAQQQPVPSSAADVQGASQKTGKQGGAQ